MTSALEEAILHRNRKADLNFRSAFFMCATDGNSDFASYSSLLEAGLAEGVIFAAGVAAGEAEG